VGLYEGHTVGMEYSYISGYLNIQCFGSKKKTKTINPEDSPVVTDLSTRSASSCLSMWSRGPEFGSLRDPKMGTYHLADVSVLRWRRRDRQRCRRTVEHRQMTLAVGCVT
jgi:hypothetical protein